MKTHTFYLLAGAAGLLALAAPISGQNAVRPVAGDDVPVPVSALIDQLAKQNKQLTANQAALEAKVDELSETIRQARLFAARGGRGGAQ